MPKDIDLKVANVCVTIKFYEDYQEEMIREAESMEIERSGLTYTHCCC